MVIRGDVPGHRAVLDQLIDDEIHEFDLVRAQFLSGGESTERLFRCFAVQANERPDEKS